MGKRILTNVVVTIIMAGALVFAADITNQDGYVYYDDSDPANLNSAVADATNGDTLFVPATAAGGVPWSTVTFVSKTNITIMPQVSGTRIVINGGGSYGVDINSTSPRNHGIGVIGCEISNASQGIRHYNVRGVTTIASNLIYDCAAEGISLSGGNTTNVYVVSNTIISNGYCAVTHNSKVSGVVITNNVIAWNSLSFGSGAGVLYDYCANNVLVDNRIYSNMNQGVVIKASSATPPTTDIHILNNDIIGGEGRAIYLDASADSYSHIIEGNTLRLCSNQNMILCYQSNVLIVNNTFDTLTHDSHAQMVMAQSPLDGLRIVSNVFRKHMPAGGNKDIVYLENGTGETAYVMSNYFEGTADAGGRQYALSRKNVTSLKVIFAQNHVKGGDDLAMALTRTTGTVTGPVEYLGNLIEYCDSTVFSVDWENTKVMSNTVRYCTNTSAFLVMQVGTTQSSNVLVLSNHFHDIKGGTTWNYAMRFVAQSAGHGNVVMSNVIENVDTYAGAGIRVDAGDYTLMHNTVSNVSNAIEYSVDVTLISNNIIGFSNDLFSTGGSVTAAYNYYGGRTPSAIAENDASVITNWMPVSLGANGDWDAPSVATSFAVTTNTIAEAILTWGAFAEGDIASYKIYRVTSNDTFTYSNVGDANLLTNYAEPSVTSFTDNTIPANGDYFYYIHAVDANGNEGWYAPRVLLSGYEQLGVIGSVSGIVKQGVTITVTKTDGTPVTTTTTTAEGAFFLSLSPDGDYVFTPSYEGFSFTPALRTNTVVSGGASGITFTSSKNYFLGGQVTGDVSNVSVLLSGDASAVTNTSAYGDYAFSLPAGNYTLTLGVTNTNYAIPIVTYEVALAGESLTNDFSIRALYTVRGTLSGEYVTNARVTLSNATTNVTVTSDSEGAYTFLIPKGTYDMYVAVADGYRVSGLPTSVTVASNTTIDETGNVMRESIAEQIEVTVPDVLRMNAGTPTISYYVWNPLRKDISVALYSLSGARVTVLAEGALASGLHEASLAGIPLVNGVYFVKTRIANERGGYDETQKPFIICQ